MKKLLSVLLFSWLLSTNIQSQEAFVYTPSESNLEARRQFSNDRFGIFIHWGIYSMFAQGEWYLNAGINEHEYSKVSQAFYPHRFDAGEWARAIKASGARYVTFTSRHHDSFSMFKTAASPYNIVDATPFGRDVAAELAEALHQENLSLHFYYSILDWKRTDYPLGRTGRRTGRIMHENYETYFDFMKQQLAELLSNYGKVRGIWLDGYWDHDSDSIPFDWRMEELYEYVHRLQPACLIGNNHHISPLRGEDFQMFERDLPGENKAGLSGQEISRLPLEMCQTMNGMWGYKVSDQNYKTTKELVHLLIRSAAKGSNLLLNVGPQPDGTLPDTAVARLKGMGEWLSVYGETIYGTEAGCVEEQEWGVSTQRDNVCYLHVLNGAKRIEFPMKWRISDAKIFKDGTRVKWQQDKKTGYVQMELPNDGKAPSAPESYDYVVAITLKNFPK